MFASELSIDEGVKRGKLKELASVKKVRGSSRFVKGN